MELHERTNLPAGFFLATARDLHRLLPAPTLIHLDGAQDRQRIFISALLHGNEDVGLLALQRVLAPYQGALLPRPLSIFIGNVDAASLGLRSRPGQPDFNRIWGVAPGLPEVPLGTPYHAMAQAVLAAMRRRTPAFAIDLHNNTGRNPPHVALFSAEPAFLQLTALFTDIAIVMDALGSLGWAFTSICPTITCECGRIGDADGLARAVALLQRCLTLEPAQLAQVDYAQLQLYRVRGEVRVPDSVRIALGDALAEPPMADLQLSRDIDLLNFLPLPGGTVIATAREDLVVEPLQVFDLQGRVIDGVFERRGGAMLLRETTVMAMLTPEERAIRETCLGYLMEGV